MLQRRIELFLSLPLKSIDRVALQREERLALQREIDNIGRQ
jgi:hypothetical protein